MPIRIHTGEDSLGTRSTATSSRQTRLQGDDAAEGLVASIRHAIIAFGPWAPRSVLTPAPGPVVAQGTAGQLVRVVLTVRNLQSALVVVSPALTMFRRADGGTWSPDHALRPASRLLWPGESTTIDLAVSVAAGVPDGIYDGSIRCLATTGMLPVRIIILEGSQQ